MSTSAFRKKVVICWLVPPGAVGPMGAVAVATVTAGAASTVEGVTSGAGAGSAGAVVETPGGCCCCAVGC